MPKLTAGDCEIPPSPSGILDVILNLAVLLNSFRQLSMTAETMYAIGAQRDLPVILCGSILITFTTASASWRRSPRPEFISRYIKSLIVFRSDLLLSDCNYTVHPDRRGCPFRVPHSQVNFVSFHAASLRVLPVRTMQGASESALVQFGMSQMAKGRSANEVVSMHRKTRHPFLECGWLNFQ